MTPGSSAMDWFVLCLCLQIVNVHMLFRNVFSTFSYLLYPKRCGYQNSTNFVVHLKMSEIFYNFVRQIENTASLSHVLLRSVYTL